MKKIGFLLLLVLFLDNTVYGQNNSLPLHSIQAHYLMEFDVNGNRYGTQIEYAKPVLQSRNKHYRLSFGGFYEIFIKDERDIEGITGNTLSNIIGATVSNRIDILKSRKVYVSNTIYAGWGYRRIKANYTNEQFNIDRSYESSINYFALGSYWKVGYQNKSATKLKFHVIGKTDFSRLVDKYEPTIFERPGFMYGIGVAYELD